MDENKESCTISMVKSIGEKVVCPLYGGGPYLGESVMGGSTVFRV